MGATECSRLEAILRERCLAGDLSATEASDLSSWLRDADRALAPTRTQPLSGFDPASILRPAIMPESPPARGLTSKPVVDCRIPGREKRPRKPTRQELADQKIRDNAAKLLGPREPLPSERRAEFDYEPVAPGVTDSGRGRR